MTDSTKLVCTGPVYVSPDGGATNVDWPLPNVEYDFCVHVANASDQPSGAFFVNFNLSRDATADINFAQDSGLDGGASVTAVVHYGSFPNEYKLCLLEACIYSSSAPEAKINCSGGFEFTVNTV